ncbi:hypothetical protein ColTof4_13456 [Colletotrichum tofieldiae]|nr:hypothetical protein ColTof3_00470 [Colletotrichum tofieldiae]GKT81033.1 hypothetical protein ColTof4_13456 [Colletotrichum tofieldiae]
MPAHFLKLWEVCNRTFSCTPRQLVSKANNLMHDTASNPSVSYRDEDGETITTQPPEWSAGFCSAPAFMEAPGSW